MRGARWYLRFSAAFLGSASAAFIPKGNPRGMERGFVLNASKLLEPEAAMPCTPVWKKTWPIWVNARMPLFHILK